MKRGLICSLMVALMCPAVATAQSITDGLIPEEQRLGELDRYYFDVLRSDEFDDIDASAAWQVHDLVVELDGLTITFEAGEFFPRRAVDGQVYGAVYLGTGRWQSSPPLALERIELERLTGSQDIDATFTDAFLQFSPQYLERFASGAEPPTGDRKQEKAARKHYRKRKPAQDSVLWDHDLVLARYHVEGLDHMDSVRIEAKLDGVRATDEAYVEGPNATFLYRYDAEDREEVALYRYRVNPANEHDRARETLCHYPRAEDREQLTRRELSYKDPTLIDIEHYEAEFTLASDPDEDEAILKADVTVLFRPVFRNVRAVAFSLVGGHEEPDSEYERRVEVRGVLDERGQMLPFVHSQGVVTVELPQPAVVDESVRLRFVYEGQLMSGFTQIDMETLSGIRLRHYSLLNTWSWFPQNLRKTFDLYTFGWTFDVPAIMRLASSGSIAGVDERGNRRHYRVEESQPSTHASVIFGDFDYIEDHDRWPVVRVFFHPAQRDSAVEILEETYTILAYFEELLDTPYPYPELDIAQMPYGVGFAQAPPGLVQMDGMAFLSKTTLVNQYNVNDPVIREMFLPHEIAHQWWAHTVGTRTSHDYWMMETFCEYCAALYREATHGDKGYDRYLKRWGVERAARNNANTTSLWLAATGRDRKRFVASAYARGPLLMHDLRTQLGWEKMVMVLRALLSEYYQQQITTEDLQMVLEQATGYSFADYFEHNVYGNAPIGEHPLVPEDVVPAEVD